MAIVPCIDINLDIVPSNNFQYCIQEISQDTLIYSYSPNVTFTWCETAVKTEPSINLHYQHPMASNQVVVANVNLRNVILVWLVSFVLSLSKLSTRNSVQGARPLSRLGVGGVITQGSRVRFFWEEGALKLSPRAHWRCLWEYSSKRYMNVPSIERLDAS